MGVLGIYSGLLSRTQISTQDVTRLCHEICDIKQGPINNKLPDDLSKISSNVLGQWDTCDKDAPGYAESIYNKLCHPPPVTVTTAQHIVIHLHPQLPHHLLKRSLSRLHPVLLHQCLEHPLGFHM